MTAAGVYPRHRSGAGMTNFKRINKLLLSYSKLQKKFIKKVEQNRDRFVYGQIMVS